MTQPTSTVVAEGEYVEIDMASDGFRFLVHVVHDGEIIIKTPHSTFCRSCMNMDILYDLHEKTALALELRKAYRRKMKVNHIETAQWLLDHPHKPDEGLFADILTGF